MPGFTIQITGIYEGITAGLAVNYGTLTQYEDAEVNIPINDARTARVKISLYDPLVQEVIAYMRMLRIYYGSTLVFWGPITEPQFQLGDATCSIAAVDPSIRLQNHFIRYGDDAEKKTETNGFDGKVPVDYRGMRMIRDAANNTPEQDLRAVPPLGILNGSANTPQGPPRLTFERSMNVWDAMKEVADHDPGPDFQLRPSTAELGAYCFLDCFNKQGTDRSATVIFQGGWGLDNLDDMTYTPGGKLITHAHVLSSDGLMRVTTTDIASSHDRGVYVEWEATDYPVTDLDDIDVLAERGAVWIDAYGVPPDYHTITPRLNSGYVYGTSYGIGDYVSSSIRRGYLNKDMTGRVTAVTLKQEAQSGMVREAITIVPDTSGTADGVEET